MKIPATCCALMDQDVDRFTDSLGPCFAMLFHDDDDGGGQHHIVNKVDIPQEIDVGGEMSGSGSPSGSLSQDMTDEDGDGQHLIVKVDIPQEIDVDDEMSGSGSPSGSPTQDMPVFEYSYVLSGNHYEDQGHKVILYTQITGSLVTRVMPSFYIFLFIISLPLNALALLTFTCRIKEKKPAVIFMSNLACVDLLLTLLLPLKIHYHLNGSHWVFGEAACRVLTSAFYCYMYCSILLMMCMSVDRLMAVVFPIASLTWRSKRNSVYVSALVWLLAFAGTTPLLSITQAVKTMNVGVTCHDVMHHDDPADQTYEYLFSILSCLYFFLPLVVTLASYCTIIYSLSTKSGRLATSSSSTLARQRRAVIMTIAVLTEFVVCFAPTNVILLYHCVLLATGGVGREGNTSYMAYMLALCAGCSSVFLDPLLYYYGSSQCRQQIRSVLRRTKRTKKISSTQSHVSV
ncbi:proteinase-activated receptor 1-like isoform X2 [Triplophysa dalaica]|uniref:proteinase-activated receptor 1-like isoform X2 n=1 Tax=Triplophysa dalaica TaxID=1582913 RepID=UPI0024DFBF62|nr:proteinase-activated receptor 1-like isoform X2 [Triplophysa dalaica]